MFHGPFVLFILLHAIQLALEDLFTIFGKVVVELERELDGSSRHSQNSTLQDFTNKEWPDGKLSSPENSVDPKLTSVCELKCENAYPK